jgi:hypothetical protein
MSCEKYSGWMTEAALGGLRAEREPELLAHASDCAVCREALAHARQVREFVDRGVASLVAGEPSPHFAARLRQRIAQEAEPARITWATWAPVIAGAFALATFLAMMVSRVPHHSNTEPNIASQTNSAAAPDEPPTVTAVSPQNATERTAHTGDSVARARKRPARTALPEIIVPQGQLAAAAQLSAAIRSGEVDGNQLLAAQHESEQPLEVRPIEIAPLETLPLDEATNQPANLIQF